MRVSVVIATFNGAEYINEQLLSIILQSKTPDQIVIVDDCSGDDTVEIVCSLLSNCRIPSVIVRNTRNIGYIRTFEKGLSLANGDYIMLSDQDDIWHTNKIADVISYFRSGVEAVTHDVEISGDTPLAGRSLIAVKRALGQRRDSMILGCASAFTHRFVQFALPFPPDIIAHDQWLNGLADACAARVIVDDCLMLYRRHQRNVSALGSNAETGTSRLSRLTIYRKELRQLEILIERIGERPSGRPSNYASATLAKQRHVILNSRIALLQQSTIGGRLERLTRNVMRGVYAQRGDGMRAFISDLFYSTMRR